MEISLKEFDFIIFGASGFTGQYVIEEFAKTCQHKPFKWAIAGRDSHKLVLSLEMSSKQTAIDLSEIKIIIADVNDEESILSMTRRTRVLLNCVGPYRFYGQQVIEACIETVTHHIDISGEPQFLETINLLCNERAVEKGVYIIGSCGWDSIPGDLGVQYLKNNFDGYLNSVEVFLCFDTGPNGYQIHFPTWECAVHGLAHSNDLRELRHLLYKNVFKRKQPKPKLKLEKKNFPFWSPVANGWCLPFPGSDKSVVQRTQQYRYEKFDENPVQMEPYFVIKSFSALILTIIFGLIFIFLTKFSWGRKLLLNYPKFFSLGTVGHDGPTREQISEAKFEMIIVGKGWDKNNAKTSVENKTIFVRVEGLDPGYVTTASCLVQSGITLLESYKDMPEKYVKIQFYLFINQNNVYYIQKFSGGVLTPGSYFSDTNIYEKLQERGLTFQIVNI